MALKGELESYFGVLVRKKYARKEISTKWSIMQGNVIEIVGYFLYTLSNISIQLARSQEILSNIC